MPVSDSDQGSGLDGMLMLLQQCRLPSDDMCHGQCPACAAPGTAFYGMSEAVFQANGHPGPPR